jgi:hypothetical protein
MTKTQEQFLNDTKTQIYQYLYRSLEEPTNGLIQLLQEISENGNLNWQNPENKEKLANIFTDFTTSINMYTLNNGDFRTYLLLQLVNIVYNYYNVELFNQFLQQGYNVSPESVVGSLSSSYSTQPPQNTNFPGDNNTSNEFVPINPKDRLVSESLYQTQDLD